MALRDRLANPVATAIPAIHATDSGRQGRLVAGIAAVAVAGAADTETTDRKGIREQFRRFRVTRPDGAGFEAQTDPATLAEARKLWPLATVQPMAEPPKGLPPTPAEAAEIRGFLGRLCGFGHPDYPDALRVALADPDAALSAFRAEGAR